MIKRGDKVYHWQRINKVGVVEEIITEGNNQLTVGGTTEARVFYRIRFQDDTVETHRSGDIQKHFD